MNKEEIATNCSTIKEYNALISYLNAALLKVSNYAQHMDNQANIMVAISSGLFVFSASKIYTQQGSISWPTIVLAVFAGLAELVALLSVNPPSLMEEEKLNDSIFYHSKVASLPSANEYYQKVTATTSDICKIIREYSNEIYNISKNSFLPKRKLFKLSRNLLILGMFFSALTFLSQHLFNFP